MSETYLWTAFFPLSNGFRDGDENRLHQIECVHVLKAASQGNAIDNRPVQLHKFLPGAMITLVSDLQEQAVAGFWYVLHGWLERCRHSGIGLFPFEIRNTVDVSI